MKLFDKRGTKEIWRELVTDFSAYGSVSFHFVVAVFLFFVFRALFYKFAIVMLATYTVLILLRSLFFMRRPKGKAMYHSLASKIDNNARFSSHAATSFALAITIGLNTSTTILTVLLIFAFLIDLSRITLKRHYPLNVVTGSAMGILVALAFNFFVF